jgi:hypothetical protein
MTLRGYRLSSNGAREQDVVLKLNVNVFRFQRLQAFLQCPNRSAPVGRQFVTVGKRAYFADDRCALI